MLTADFNYKDVTIPKGFTTDGLTYKIRLLGVIINKFDPRYITAAIVHDYLCELESYAKADQYFEELLPTGWKSAMMVKGVKLYHRIRYGTK